MFGGGWENNLMDHKSTKTAPCKSVLGDYRLDDSQVESSRSERQISDTFPGLSHSPFSLSPLPHFSCFPLLIAVLICAAVRLNLIRDNGDAICTRQMHK